MKRGSDGWPVPAILIGMGVACLVLGEFIGARVMFFVALVALINELPPPNCCHDCRQGRRPCKRKGTT